MKQQIKTVIAKFGTERFLALLPQENVRQALDLVTTKEVAESIGLKYSSFRTQMQKGKIPYPTTKINRRTYYTRQEADLIKANWSQNEK